MLLNIPSSKRLSIPSSAISTQASLNVESNNVVSNAGIILSIVVLLYFILDDL